MDVKCSMQSTDHNPDYDSIILRGIDITPTVERYIDDQDYEFMELGQQSSDTLTPLHETHDTDNSNIHQNVGFVDQIESVPMSMPTTLEHLQLDTSSQVEMGDFLKRPVLIQNYTWTEGLPLFQQFEPWSNFFTSAVMRKKFDNFYMVRCNLHVKIVINASPFYYSCAMASYRPLTNIAGDGAFRPCKVSPALGGLSSQATMARSQRPHIFIYPQSSEGGNMELPFFYHKNWLDLTSAADLGKMGTITLESLDFPLENANGIAGGLTNILVYAWADNVQLAGPTLKLQAKDEYSKNPVSSRASAIARAASNFVDWPVIGLYATATSLAASATAQIASLFGYTNVPVIDNVLAIKFKTTPNLATTDIGIPYEKLTLDCKNELSIDNKLNGVDLGDELIISRIVTRETFLDTVRWAASDAPGYLLFNSRVTPDMCSRVTETSRNYIQGTPMWMVSKMFQYWRGDIIFRFKFLHTQYHRGRVKISWDPIGDIAVSATETTSMVYTKIVDITEENDVEVSIPYTQLTSYLTVANTGDTQHWRTAALSSSDTGLYNGLITLRVLNYQTSPVASADIGVAVFVRGADNLEFACPKEFGTDLEPYVVQSKDVYTTPTPYELGNAQSQPNDNINLIHMGETVKSLRQLMRRATFSRRSTWQVSALVANRVAIYQSVIPRMPSQPGFDPNGLNQANNTLSAGVSRYNFTTMTIIDWVNNCFVAHKGSILWTVESRRDTSQAIYNMSLDRSHNSRTLAQFLYNDGYNTDTNNGNAYWAMFNNPHGIAGKSISSARHQPSIQVSVPFYSKYKFASNSPDLRNLGNSEDDSNIDSMLFTMEAYTPSSNKLEDVRSNWYCSIGTDFNSIFFLNVPCYYESFIPNPSG